MRTKMKLLPFVLGLLPLATHSASASAANETPAAGAMVQIEEVMVTARKTEESQQVVPVTVAALSADAMQAMAVFNVNDLQSHVTGFVIAPENQTGIPNFSIRVAKQGNGTAGGIATYMDDVPAVAGWGISHSMYDVNSVSVLKGPQGTLFGVNTTGGAVVIRPNKPTDKFEGYAELGIGDYDLKQFEGMVNIPVNEVLQLRLAGHVTDRDKGYIKNATPTNDNKYFETDKHESLRFSMRLKPSTALTNDLVADYFHEDDQGPQGVPLAFNYTGLLGLLGFGLPAGALFPGSPALPGDPTIANLAANQAAMGPRTVATFDPSKPNLRESTYRKVKVWGIANTTNYEVDDSLSFKNVLAYQDSKADFASNYTGTPVFLVTQSGQTNVDKQWTEEFTVNVNALDKRLRFIGGIFLSDRKADVDYASMNFWVVDPTALATSSPLLTQVFGFPSISLASFKREFKSHAMYGQATYDLTKELSATLGLRYTWDEGTYHSSLHGQTGTGAIFTANPFAPAACKTVIMSAMVGYDGACGSSNNKKWQAPSFVFTLQDQFAEKSMVYATLRGGYQGGGFNNGAPRPIEIQTYDPEKVVDFETGLKSDWTLWDRPIRTNVDVFYGNYKNMQRVQNWQYTSGPLNGQGAIAVFNAGAANYYGTDLEVTYFPTDNLELNASLTHIESEYQKFQIPSIPNSALAVPQDLSGSTLALTPKDTWTFGARWTLPFSSDIGKVTAAYTTYYRSDMTNTDVPAVGGSAPQYDIVKEYWVSNMTVDWKSVYGSRFDANLWVKNLFDKRYLTAVNNQYGSFGMVWGWRGEPRTVGLNVRYNFD